MTRTLRIASLLVVALMGLVTVGCSATASTEGGADLVLCGDCGHVKGGDGCCADGAEDCNGCNLDKGSPGCCVEA